MDIENTFRTQIMLLNRFGGHFGIISGIILATNLDLNKWVPRQLTRRRHKTLVKQASEKQI